MSPPDWVAWPGRRRQDLERPLENPLPLRFKNDQTRWKNVFICVTFSMDLPRATRETPGSLSGRQSTKTTTKTEQKQCH